MQNILNKIQSYNQEWNEIGETDRSCMPIGNGELCANVWVTKKGIRMYFSSSDSINNWGENLKYGLVKISFVPNIFDSCEEFSQKLNLLEGSVEISAKKNEKSFFAKIFIDKFSNTIYINGNSQTKLKTHVEYFNWRCCRGDEACDFVRCENNNIFFYYRAKESCVDEASKIHAVYEYKNKIYDPYKDRIFGGCIKAEEASASECGENFAKIVSDSPSQSFNIKISTRSEQEPDTETFIERLRNDIKLSQDSDNALSSTSEWWKKYWTDSWIFVSGDSPKKISIQKNILENCSFEKGTEYKNADSNITRAYVLTKYIFACNAYGKFPIYFNGLLFNTMPGAGFGYAGFEHFNEAHTAQPIGEPDEKINPDARCWVTCNVIWQNVRLPYYSMLARNELKSIKILFDYYRRFTDINKIKAKLYYNAQGQFSTEINMFCGLMHPSIYGRNRDGKPDGYSENRWGGAVDISPGLELAYLMLDFFRHTGDKDFLLNEAIPYAKDVLLYTATRFKERDSKGKIILYPLNCIETYWDTKNPITVVSGMRAVAERILRIDSDIKFDREFFADILSSTPEIPIAIENGKRIMKPAEEYDAKENNVEHSTFYAIYPFENHTKYSGDYELALNSYYSSLSDRKKVFKARTIGEPISEPSYSGWQYIGMTAALLGLKDEAKEILSHNAVLSNPGYRFPAMWGPIYDAVPDVDHGANILNTLQLMAFKVKDNKIYILPAWPEEWNVSFKLYADKDTAVICEYKNGKIVTLKTEPEECMYDIICEV